MEAVESAIRMALAQLKRDLTASSVSPGELIKAKYGYDQLHQRIDYAEREFASRFAALERNIDRFMGEEQIRVDNKQVRVGWWGIAIGAAIGVLVGILAPLALRAFGIVPPV